MSTSTLANHVAQQITGLKLAGEVVTVAFSGGRDSVALLDVLHGLASLLGFNLHALHVNHHISPTANSWQQFCEQFCSQRGIPLSSHPLQLQRSGGESLEALAREGRYAAFAQAAGRFVFLAQHQDDQAETFLLQAIRGAGPAGLAGMPFVREQRGKLLVRPLLNVARSEIERYLNERQLSWIDDESNLDTRYRRNAIRHQVLPVLEAMHPGSTRALARSAQHCAEANDLLQELAALDGDPEQAQLSVAALTRLSLPRAKNLFRAWLLKRGVALPATSALNDWLQQVLHAEHDKQPEFKVATGSIRRFAGKLYWVTDWQGQASSFEWKGEPELRLPGWQGTLQFQTAPVGVKEELLLGQTLELRLRQGGEKIVFDRQRPSQTLKNLFQQAAIPPWERERWPLVYVNNELITVPGIATALAWQSTPGLAIIWQPD